jgi:hypothetical protein
MKPFPKNHYRKWIVIGQGLFAIYVLFCFSGCISWTTTTTTNVEHLSHGIEIHTKSRDTREFTCIVRDGLALIPRSHHYVNDKYERIILTDGKELARCEHFNYLFISPDQTYIVLAYRDQAKPIRILDLPTRQIRELTVDGNSKDELHSYYKTYPFPFRFIRWEDDSNFLVEATGTFSEKIKDENGNDVTYK